MSKMTIVPSMIKKKEDILAHAYFKSKNEQSNHWFIMVNWLYFRCQHPYIQATCNHAKWHNLLQPHSQTHAK